MICDIVTTFGAKEDAEFEVQTHTHTQLRAVFEPVFYYFLYQLSFERSFQNDKELSLGITSEPTQPESPGMAPCCLRIKPQCPDNQLLNTVPYIERTTSLQDFLNLFTETSSENTYYLSCLVLLASCISPALAHVPKLRLYHCLMGALQEAPDRDTLITSCNSMKNNGNTENVTALSN